MKALLTRTRRSPYLAGVALGLVVTASVGLHGKRLSGAGAYQQLSSVLGDRLTPSSTFYRHIVGRGMTWDLWVLVGSFFGALACALLANEARLRWMPDRQWEDVFGPSVARRWLLAFAGAFLAELGGGLAGGCTASLALSGGAMMAPAAFVFMAGMFGGGIPVAMVIYRRRSRP